MWGYVIGAVVSAAAVFWAYGAFAGEKTSPVMDVGSPPPPPPKGWTDEDWQELANIADEVRANPADMAAILDGESRFDPTAVNRDASGFPLAVGIAQWTAASNPATGLTEAERVALPGKSVAEQLKVLRRYYKAMAWVKQGKPFPHAGAVYAVNFVPARALVRGVTLDTVLVDKSDGLMYTRNQGLDRGGKGAITVRDLVETLRTATNQTRYKGALAALRRVTGRAGLSPNLPR